MRCSELLARSSILRHLFLAENASSAASGVPLASTFCISASACGNLSCCSWRCALGGVYVTACAPRGVHGVEVMRRVPHLARDVHKQMCMISVVLFQSHAPRNVRETLSRAADASNIYPHRAVVSSVRLTRLSRLCNLCSIADSSASDSLNVWSLEPLVLNFPVP